MNIETKKRRKQMKKKLIQEILLQAKANDLYISGDLFFSLAFRTEKELIKICRKIGINPK